MLDAVREFLDFKLVFGIYSTVLIFVSVVYFARLLRGLILKSKTKYEYNVLWTLPGFLLLLHMVFPEQFMSNDHNVEVFGLLAFCLLCATLQGIVSNPPQDTKKDTPESTTYSLREKDPPWEQDGSFSILKWRKKR